VNNIFGGWLAVFISFNMISIFSMIIIFGLELFSTISYFGCFVIFVFGWHDFRLFSALAVAWHDDIFGSVFGWRSAVFSTGSFQSTARPDSAIGWPVLFQRLFFGLAWLTQPVSA
jgi:hypothetical protein